MSDPPTPSLASDGSLRLTYAAIAARLGISTDAARQLARRRGWERVHGNHPGAAATIIVPPDELDEERWREARASPPGDRATPPNETGRTKPDTGGLLAGALAALEDAVTGLRGQLDVANARAERAEADRADERQRADDLRDRLIMLQEQLADANAALEEAAASNARAERAEATVAGERQQADALRERLDAAELAKRQAEEAAELARSQATHAHKSVAELRKAETDRRERGLLARLRAAVRGR